MPAIPKIWLVAKFCKSLLMKQIHARGGLEPAFRVLFSAIFHEFRSGISIGVENYGIERKQNCSFFVVKLLTKFSCVLAIVCLPQ